MTTIYTLTVPLRANVVDAFCTLQKGFTDQFVYYRKDSPVRYMGLGRCVALPTLEGVEYRYGEEPTSGHVSSCVSESASRYASDSVLGHTTGHASVAQPPVFFSFNRFDAANPSAPDDLMASFPRLKFMLPEIVLIENDRGTMLQVNSLGPVYAGRVDRFVRAAAKAQSRCAQAIPYRLIPDEFEAWDHAFSQASEAMASGRVDKVVLSRRLKLEAAHPFSSKDLLVNLIDGNARGTVIMYRYADVFFCGCTPELLVRKTGSHVESMCLAGTCGTGATDVEREQLARELMADTKNRVEHDYVVQFIRNVLARVCYNVHVPHTPEIMSLSHVQHLYTPAHAEALEGEDLWSLVEDLHPTPATSGTPVGEAKMLIRSIEPYNRGFYAGAAGYIDADGDGEFSVALRTGVFDGEIGWVYAGCGLVGQSDSRAEFDEIDAKLKTILSAFG